MKTLLIRSIDDTFLCIKHLLSKSQSDDIHQVPTILYVSHSHHQDNELKIKIHE